MLMLLVDGAWGGWVYPHTEEDPSHHYINTLILVSHSQSTESNMVIKCTGTA